MYAAGLTMPQGLMKKDKKEIEYIEKAIAVHSTGINVPRITLCQSLSRIVCVDAPHRRMVVI